jgi:hypothetical protein
MSILSKASLVQIPSGYGEDKLYSEVPNTAAGDFTFTRASTGTRVNADGFIEEVPWNQLTYSEDFSSWGTWRQGAALPVIVTTDVVESPIGTLTADRIQCDQVAFGSPNRVGVRQDVTFAPLQRFTISVWARSASGSDETFQIVGRNATSITQGGNFIATNEWQKFSRILEMRSTGVTVNVIIGLFQNTDVLTTDIYLWGAQIVLGETEKTYIKTTDRLDIPRLDYTGGATCPTLLLEPQRTNLALGSENLSLNYWHTSAGSSMVNDTTISPDGTQNASTLTFGSSQGSQYEDYFAGSYGNQTHTVSCYVKVASGTAKFRFKCSHWGVADFYSDDYTATDEWQRFTFSKTFTASGGTGIIAGLKNETAGGSKDILVYGFQLETNASYPTSYIPTSGTSVTRVTEFCNKTSIPSLIGQTEGAFFLDFVYTGLYDNSLSFLTRLAEDNTNTNRIGIYSMRSNDALRTFCNSNNVGQFDAQIGTLVIGQRYKVAMRYKINDFSIYLNGTNVYTNTSADVPLVLNDYVLGNIPNTILHSYYCKTNQATLFNEALTDSELITLTTI